MEKVILEHNNKKLEAICYYDCNDVINFYHYILNYYFLDNEKDFEKFLNENKNIYLKNKVKIEVVNETDKKIEYIDEYNDRIKKDKYMLIKDELGKEYLLAESSVIVNKNFEYILD